MKIRKSNEQSKMDDFSPLTTAIQKISDNIDGFVYPLIIPPIDQIDEDIIFNIFDDFNKIGKQDKLHVFLYSYGGDAHSAFLAGKLLQKYSNELKIYILREAKSAATLIAASSNEIVFSDISELGPLDPQIVHQGLKRRISPLSIKHALDLLNSEATNNHEVVVGELAKKLPDPLLLGEYLKSLETSKDYLIKLLSLRMFKDESSDKIDIKKIAERLVMNYPDHGYCIDYDEANDIGLIVSKIDKKLSTGFSLVMASFRGMWKTFNMYRLNNDKDKAVQVLIDIGRVRDEVIDYQLNKQKKNKRRNTKNKK
ncbi:MAG TPA: hypothetical protein ENI76_05005 [Ignavibacteria bacterium]|nr:hypothetical protein [Ignavibacteria bacterium]